ncbi:MAG TPA: glycosyltransferase family 39 protein [Gemmatimonadaceae bacterium]|nr:glycosyltransferase family 39 protein [Gemmatimonadaceae bacterium]
MIGLVAIGALLRLYYLDQPMRYDESITYLHFASQPWETAIGSYTYPNNHVFHTLLVKACVSLLGDDPWVLRLPAYVAGVAMIPMTYWVGRRVFGSTAAYVGTALVAGSGALVLYSTNARGYTMICAATLILAGLLLRLRERPSVTLWAAVVVVAALGMWTIPVMLLPAGGLASWFVLSALSDDTSERRGDLVRVGLAIVATALLTALLYRPILSRHGLAALTENAFVSATPWRVFYRDLSSSIEHLSSGWSLGIPSPIAVALGACAAVGLVSARRRDAMRVSMAGSVYLWCAVLLIVTHRVPFARVWLFLVAPTALFAACGLVRLLASRPSVHEQVVMWPGASSAMAATLLSIAVILSRDVVTSRETGTLYHAEQIAEAFRGRLRPGDRVIAPLPSNGPLAYYFLREGLDTTYLSATPRDSARVFLIVNTAEGYTVRTRLSEPLMQRFQNAQLMVRYPTAEIYEMH